MFTLEEKTAPAKNKLRELTYASALREAFLQEMTRDERVFLFGLDVDDHKGIQGSTVGLADLFGPARVFGTPLSEDAMTGVAVGAAMAGLRPIHTHIRMDFVLLCMNQLVNMAAKAHYMYDGQLNVPLVVRAMIGRSWGQGAQHSQALQSFFMHVPGLKVVAPSNAHDAKHCMIAAIRDNNPVIFIEHRLLYSTKAYVNEACTPATLGKARVLTQGNDVTIVAISHMVTEALRAKQLLESVGIHADIIDPISLVPLDINTIVTSAKKTKRLLIIDNAWLTCGASSEIMAQVIEHTNDPINMARMGFAHTTCPTTRVLEDHFYPNQSTIATKAYKMVTGKTKTDWPLVNAEEIDGFKGPF